MVTACWADPHVCFSLRKGYSGGGPDDNPGSWDLQLAGCTTWKLEVGPTQCLLHHLPNRPERRRGGEEERILLFLPWRVTGRLRRCHSTRSCGCYTFTSTTKEGLTIWWCCSEDGSGVARSRLSRLCHRGRSSLAVLRYGVLSGGSKQDVLISRNKESLDF
jgi:hypothetical protein